MPKAPPLRLVHKGSFNVSLKIYAEIHTLWLTTFPQVSSLAVKDFTLGEATYMADFFQQTMIDGILGMAFRAVCLL